MFPENKMLPRQGKYRAKFINYGGDDELGKHKPNFMNYRQHFAEFDDQRNVVEDFGGTVGSIYEKQPKSSKHSEKIIDNDEVVRPYELEERRPLPPSGSQQLPNWHDEIAHVSPLSHPFAQPISNEQQQPVLSESISSALITENYSRRSSSKNEIIRNTAKFFVIFFAISSTAFLQIIVALRVQKQPIDKRLYILLAISYSMLAVSYGLTMLK